MISTTKMIITAKQINKKEDSYLKQQQNYLRKVLIKIGKY